MAIVGVLHLTSITVPPATSQTPAATIISHLSDLYPTQTHDTFHLDHRLFVSTSSLLPQDASKRTYTHFFTSSHTPQKTYVGTTSPSSSTGEPTDVNASKNYPMLKTIAIPTATSLEPFLALIAQKLTPQWAARQFVVLDNGASITLPVTDDASWKISVGDLRLAPSRVSGSAAGQSRGVVIELQYENAANSVDAAFDTEEGKSKYEKLFRSLLKALFRNVKVDLKLDDTKMHLAKASVVRVAIESEINDKAQQEQKQHSQDKPLGHEIPELYMEVLRGSRG